MACPDPFEDERVELRWLWPDGREATSVQMRYRTIEEAMAAVAAVLDAFEEVRREGTGSCVDARSQKVEP